MNGQRGHVDIESQASNIKTMLAKRNWDAKHSQII